MVSTKKRDFNKEIIECLNKNSFGLTITKIAEEIETTRNTIYRYLGKLEGRKLVFKKKVGNYVLYFSKEKSIDQFENILPIYKNFLKNLKKEFPLKEPSFKRIGKSMVDFLSFPINIEGYENIEDPKSIPNKKLFSLIETLLPLINVLDNKINISIIDLNKENTRAVYQITNSVMLEEGEFYLYHFHILTGYIEETLTKLLERPIKSEIIGFEIFEKKEDSYINVSVILE